MSLSRIYYFTLHWYQQLRSVSLGRWFGLQVLARRGQSIQSVLSLICPGVSLDKSLLPIGHSFVSQLTPLHSHWSDHKTQQSYWFPSTSLWLWKCEFGKHFSIYFLVHFMISNYNSLSSYISSNIVCSLYCRLTLQLSMMACWHIALTYAGSNPKLCYC